jgi:hypothetical protein
VIDWKWQPLLCLVPLPALRCCGSTLFDLISFNEMRYFHGAFLLAHEMLSEFSVKFRNVHVLSEVSKLRQEKNQQIRE